MKNTAKVNRLQSLASKSLETSVAVGIHQAIYINLGHTAYLNLQDHPEIQLEYLREQMLKQYVWLYLSEGKYDMFGSEFADLEPQEAAPRVLDKIETVYYESLR